MLLYSSYYKNKKLTRGEVWWRRTAHIALAIGGTHLLHSLTKSRSLSSPPPTPPLCPWPMAACHPPPPPLPSISAAMLDKRSEKNTSERERERERKKNKDLLTFIYLQMHMFFYTRPAAAVGQSSLQQHFILYVRMGNGVS